VGLRADLDVVVKRKIPDPPGNRTLEPRLSSRDSSVAIPTELSLLSLFMQHLTFEVFTEVKFQVKVVCVVMPSNVVVGCKRFGGTLCLHLQGVYTVSQTRIFFFPFRLSVKYFPLTLCEQKKTPI
jgi:hypothetical protein